jgi:hypothetical protein
MQKGSKFRKVLEDIENMIVMLSMRTDGDFSIKKPCLLHRRDKDPGTTFLKVGITQIRNT